MLDTDLDLCQSDSITAPVPFDQEPAPCSAATETDRTKNRRGRPRITSERPWQAEGISRSTYYERLKPAAPTQISYAIDEPRWYCIRTEFGAEITADMAIRTAEFETFFPMLWIAPLPARRTEMGRLMPAQSERLVPLFRRYIFARFLRSDPSWRRIATMRGVERIFSTSPTTPIPVPDVAIDIVRKQCHPNGVVYPPGHGEKRAAMEIGAIGRIPNSAFPDLVGICDWSEGDRVRLLMSIMGRQVPVTVDRSAVEII